MINTIDKYTKALAITKGIVEQARSKFTKPSYNIIYLRGSLDTFDVMALVNKNFEYIGEF